MREGSRELGAGRPQSHEHTELQGGQGGRGGERLVPGKVRQRTAGELLKSEAKAVYPHMGSYSALRRKEILPWAVPWTHLGAAMLSETGPSQDNHCAPALVGGAQCGQSTELEAAGGPSG